MTVGPLTIEPYTREVRVDGELVDLTKQEFALLLYLASNPERVYDRRDILQDVWGWPRSAKSRTMDSHAYRLRKKLSINGHRFVMAVWGVGLRLTFPQGPTSSTPDLAGVRCPHCGGSL